MVYIIIGGLLLLADQALKLWAVKNIELNTIAGVKTLIPGFLQMTRIHNKGIAFGLFSKVSWLRWALLGLLVVFTAVMLWLILSKKLRGGFRRFTAVLMLVGIFSNGLDRLLFGYVVDMFELIPIKFAIFNLADILAVSFGIMFLLSVLFMSAPEEDEEEEPVRKPARKRPPEGARPAKRPTADGTRPVRKRPAEGARPAQAGTTRVGPDGRPVKRRPADGTRPAQSGATRVGPDGRPLKKRPADGTAPVRKPRPAAAAPAPAKAAAVPVRAAAPARAAEAPVQAAPVVTAAPEVKPAAAVQPASEAPVVQAVPVVKPAAAQTAPAGRPAAAQTAPAARPAAAQTAPAARPVVQAAPAVQPAPAAGNDDEFDLDSILAEFRNG